MLTEFTDSDRIRAVVGVSDHELPDDVLTSPDFETLIALDLDDVASGLLDEFRVVSAILYPSRTFSQQRFFDVTQLFCTYSVAKQLLTPLGYLAERRLQDGRAMKERVEDPFSTTRDGVNAMYSSLRIKLSAAFVTATGGTATPLTRVLPTLSVGVGLATDPVTNA